MRIYQLEGFYYVGKHLGYTAAANAMPYPIGQPAVFQQVKTLEGDLGIKLLSKPKKGKLQLTPEGRHLHDFIVPFFEQLPQIERALKGGDQATLVIGAPHIVLTEWLPSRLKTLRARHAGLLIHLMEENEPERLLDHVLNGRLDLAIHHFPDLPVGVSHRAVGLVEGAAVVPRNHALAKRTSLIPGDLSSHPLLTYPSRHFVRHIIDAAFQKVGASMNVAYEVPTRELMLRYVGQGLGIAVIPYIKGVPRSSLPEGVHLIPMPGVFGSRALHLVTRQGMARTPILLLALEVLGQAWKHQRPPPK